MKRSTKQDGRPSLQWYPRDPLSDTGLKLSSLAAQGLWYNMLWIMYDSPERGVLLQANGKQVSENDLASILGKNEAKVKQYLSELEDREVFSKRDDNAIYCRRMYRKWKLSRTRAQAGRKGGKGSKKQAKQASLSLSSTSSSNPPTPQEGGDKPPRRSNEERQRQRAESEEQAKQLLAQEAEKIRREQRDCEKEAHRAREALAT